VKGESTNGAARGAAARVPAAGATGLGGLAASQLRRVRRIVDAAVRLAETGGFEAVRLRDVAVASDVALGTLYKYFHSKEDILLFALNEEAERLEAALAARPAQGGNALERVADLFARATRGFVRRPSFARAIVRAIAGGDEAISVQSAGFHLRVTRLVVTALRGEAPPQGAPLTEAVGSEREQQLTMVLQHVWFAALVGWAGGLHPVREVVERVRTAAELMSIEDEE
jgi:AcrR family transcriptional regulator